MGALLSGSERNRVSLLVSIKSAAHEMHSIYSKRMHVVAHFSYMVDAADQEKVEASRNELHNLLDKPQLQGIPVSVDPKLCVCVFFVITAAVKQNLCVSCRKSCLLQFQVFFLCVEVLVLGNKRDLPTAIDEKQLIEKM